MIRPGADDAEKVRANRRPDETYAAERQQTASSTSRAWVEDVHVPHHPDRRAISRLGLVWTYDGMESGHDTPDAFELPEMHQVVSGVEPPKVRETLFAPFGMNADPFRHQPPTHARALSGSRAAGP